MEHFIQDHAELPDCRGAGPVSTLEIILWRHMLRRSCRAVQSGEAGSRGKIRPEAEALTLEDAIHRSLGVEAAHAEIDDPDSRVPRARVNQDVFKLQISVKDALSVKAFNFFYQLFHDSLRQEQGDLGVTFVLRVLHCSR